MSKNRIGWITYFENDPQAALDRAKELGFDNIQAGRPTTEWESPEKRAELGKMVKESGVDVTALFVAFKTEDYSSIEAIHNTGGFLPPAEREERRQLAFSAVEIAVAIGCPGIAAHLGFIPDDPQHEDYIYLKKVVGEVADRCQDAGLNFSFETGQEKAATLKRFITDLGHENIGVNFDPANMILYGSGEPLEAIDILGPHLLGVHAKDGTWAAPDVRGKEWGAETALGEGDVDFPKLIEKIKGFGFTGPITIEREVSGDQQVTDIEKARKLLESLL